MGAPLARAVFVCLLAAASPACKPGSTSSSPDAGNTGDAAACADCTGACTPTGCLVTLPATSMGPVYLAVDPSTIYFANPTTSFMEDTGLVGMVPQAGGPAVILASAQRPTGIVVNGSGVYWSNDKSFGGGDASIRAMPLGGGAVTVLASGLESATGIALDATSVYWLGFGGVYAMPLGGGPVTALVAGAGQTTAGPVVDSTSAYWIGGAACGDGGLPCSELQRVPLDGGPGLPVFSGGSEFPLGSVFAVAGGNAYVTSTECGDAGCGQALLEVALGDGAATMLAASPVLGTPVAADSTHVYWEDAVCDGGPCGSLSLFRGDPSGASPVVLAEPVGSPLVLDATSIYWGMNGNVMRLTPR